MSHHIIVTENISRYSRNVIEINPFDKDNLKMLKEYDTKNKTTYSKYALDSIKNSDKEKYELEKLVFPVFKGIYCNYDSDGINNVCIAEYETDLKIFKVYIDEKNFEIIQGLCSYAFNNLGMEQFMVLVSSKSKNLINSLCASEFIPLYDENSKEEYIPFIREKEDFNLSEAASVICI